MASFKEHQRLFEN